MTAASTRRSAQQRIERQRGRHLRAVDEGQAFLGPELQRLQAGAFQRLRARQPHAVERGLAFADQGQAQVRQRREVARRAHRALRRNDRQHAAVVQRQQAVDDFLAHARKAAREAGRLEQQHQAHHAIGQRLADAHGMRAQQFSCSSARSSRAMRCVASLPKPVLTP
jgi:hypothetical protein